MKRRRAKPKVKDYRIKMNEELDDLWQLLFKGKPCIICGKPAYCGHHIFGKKASTNLRWDPKNGVPICMGNHREVHNGVITTCKKLIEAIGQERLDWLIERQAIPLRLTIEKAEAIREYLECELAKQDSNWISPPPWGTRIDGPQEGSE